MFNLGSITCHISSVACYICTLWYNYRKGPIENPNVLSFLNKKKVKDFVDKKTCNIWCYLFFCPLQVAESLCSSDCFLLQSGNSMFAWQGSASSFEQQQWATKVAEFLKVWFKLTNIKHQWNMDANEKPNTH